MADDTKPGSLPVARGSDLRTFLIADIRGYTRFTQSHGDDAASLVATRFAAVVRTAVGEFSGELLELRGDEALCVFVSPREAVQAAVDLQRRVRQPSEGEEVFPLGIGIGLDAGEAIPTEGGYRGRALNFAARLCSAAKGGEILVSDGLAHLAHPISGVKFGAPHSIRIKGVSEAVRVVVVEPEVPLPPAPRPARPVRSRRRVGGLVVGVGVALAVIAVVVAVSGSGGPGPRPLAVASNSVAVVDAKTDKVVKDVRLAAAPDQVTPGPGAVWVGEDSSQSVQRISTNGQPGTPVGLGIQPSQLLYAFDSVWVYDSADNRLASIDPSGRTPLDVRTPLPHCAPADCGVGGLAADQSGLWLGRCCVSSHIPIAWAWHLNRKTLKRGPRVGHVPSERLVFGGGTLWAYGANGFFEGTVDPTTNHSTPHHINGVPAVYNSPGLTYAFGHAWLVSPAGNLLEYDQSGQDRTINIPHGGYDVTAGGNYLWVSGSDGTITQVDPYTQTSRVILRLHHAAYGIAYLDNKLWIAVGGANANV